MCNRQVIWFWRTRSPCKIYHVVAFGAAGSNDPHDTDGVTDVMTAELHVELLFSGSSAWSPIRIGTVLPPSQHWLASDDLWPQYKQLLSRHGAVATLTDEIIRLTTAVESNTDRSRHRSPLSSVMISRNVISSIVCGSIVPSLEIWISFGCHGESTVISSIRQFSVSHRVGTLDLKNTIVPSISNGITLSPLAIPKLLDLSASWIIGDDQPQVSHLIRVDKAHLQLVAAMPEHLVESEDKSLTSRWVSISSWRIHNRDVFHWFILTWEWRHITTFARMFVKLKVRSGHARVGVRVHFAFRFQPWCSTFITSQNCHNDAMSVGWLNRRYIHLPQHTRHCLRRWG